MSINLNISEVDGELTFKIEIGDHVTETEHRTADSLIKFCESYRKIREGDNDSN